MNENILVTTSCNILLSSLCSLYMLHMFYMLYILLSSGCITDQADFTIWMSVVSFNLTDEINSNFEEK